jgi:hypothetical protein
LTGAWAVSVFLILLLLAIVGNLTLLRDLFGVQIGTNVLGGIGAVVLVGNLLYRANRRASSAEEERDLLRKALDAQPDPNEVPRQLLALHDEGQAVLQHFHNHLERMEASMPIGIAAYGDWFARCTRLVEQERPAYALALRQARILSRDYPPQLVKSENMEHWVDMAQSQMYRDAVTNAMGVLALVIREGQETQRQM